MPSVIVIADDLTGAADTGVTFARHGMTARVVWDFRQLSEADVLIVSTESRQCRQHEAVARVRGAMQHLVKTGGALQGSPWIYKKIDSTLRGHPGAELLAVMEASGAPKAVVAPAFPAQGRTTVNGCHYVQGVPLAETSFGQEVGTSDIRQRLLQGFIGDHDAARTLTEDLVDVVPLDLVRRGEPALEAALTASASLMIVADVETEEDLLTVARAAIQYRTQVLCGSAGLARALAAVLADKPDTAASLQDATVPAWRGRGVLVVIGSRHSATMQQLNVLEAEGASVVAPSTAWFVGEDCATIDPVSRLVAALRQPEAPQYPTAVLTTARLPHLPEAGERLVARMGEAVRGVLDDTCPAGLVLTGGDVAIAVCRALEAEAIQLVGEVQAGIPWGYLVGGAAAGMPVVTKAGGFGDDTSLSAVAKFIASKGVPERQRSVRRR